MGFILFDSLTYNGSDSLTYNGSYRRLSASTLFMTDFYVIMFLVYQNADKMLFKKNLKGREHLGDLGG